MPELPEVESARKHVHDLCAGHRIVRVVLKEQGGGPRQGTMDDIIFEKPSDDIVASLLKGKGKTNSMEKMFEAAFLNRCLEAVNRKGKQMWMTFTDSDALPVLFHFGMTGSFIIRDHVIPSYKSFKVTPGEESAWPPRFTKCELEFDNGVSVAYCDPRRIGRIRIRKDPLSSEPISLLGIDPYCDTLPTVPDLLQLLSAFSAPIKAVLLDQEKIFCGIGNYLADEILYQAGIHPETKACRINSIGVQRLLEKMHYIIHTACSVDARYEDFPTEWLFHYRWDKVKSKSQRLRMPSGEIIVFETCGGRTSAIVPSKQPKSGDYTRAELLQEEEVGESTQQTNVTKGKGKKIEVKKEAPVTNIDEKESVATRKRKAPKIKEEPQITEDTKSESKAVRKRQRK